MLGLVSISGGSGRYFLAVDRSPSNASEEDIYLLVHLRETGGIEFYFPDCEGTPPMDGLTISEAGKSGKVCSFTSESAVMRAALEAEGFLSARHIVAVTPLRALVRVDEDDAPAH